jgi:hypothetical protein
MPTMAGCSNLRLHERKRSELHLSLPQSASQLTKVITRRALGASSEACCVDGCDLGVAEGTVWLSSSPTLVYVQVDVVAEAGERDLVAAWNVEAKPACI